MDFLKEAGLPNIGVIFRAILGIIVIGTLFVTGRYLFEHPLVLVLVLAAVGGLVYLYNRYRKKKNRV